MNRSQVRFAHGSLVLNEQYTNANPPLNDPTKYQDCITLDRVRVKPAYRTTLDPLHLALGATAGRVHRGPLFFSVEGRMVGPDATQDASLADKERALRAALDPDLCYRDSPATEGVYAWDWLDPTNDTTNFATGWAPRRYYVRPMNEPATSIDILSNPSRPWSCELVAPDPRCYAQTLTSVVSSGGNPTVTVPNIGNAPAPLRLTIVTTAAANALFTIRSGGVDFVLDLSGAAETYIVTMETSGPFGNGKTVKKGGVDAFSLKKSGPSTWLSVPPGGATFQVLDFTNASATYETRAAWA